MVATPRLDLRPSCAGLLGALAGLLIGLPGCRGDADRDVAARERPSLILISIDSLRADHLGCYGYGRDTSPRLDRLASEGVRFSSVVAETSWTLPAHATLLTGLSSDVHQVQTDDRRLAPRFSTLAEVLRDHGYGTHGIWSGPYLHPSFGLGQGFDPGDYEGVGVGGSSADGRVDLGGSIDTVTSPEVIDRAIAFLERPHDAPFFLFLHLFDVHFDYRPPEEFWRRFDPDYQGSFTGANFPFNLDIHPGMPAADRRHLIARYDGEIAFADSHIGRLLDALERLGRTRDTLVAVTADHGDEFLEHGGKGHQATLYDEVIRVPLILRRDGALPAGRTIASQIRHVDVMPTLLGLLRVPIPSTAMGSNLADVARGEATMRDLVAVARLTDSRVGAWSAVRTPTWKYIHRRRGNDEREELYDLTGDPGEQAPIADPARLERARKRLAQIASVEEELRGSIGVVAGDRVADVPDGLRERLRELGYVR